MSGIGIAKLMGLIALPFLANYYSTTQFGILGVYLAVVLIFKSFSNGGFEVAILLPEVDEEASGILKLCQYFNNSLFLIIFCLCLFFYATSNFEFIDQIFDNKNLLLFIPFSIWLEGRSMALKYWLNRKKIYAGISRAIIAQAIITVSLQFLFAKFSTPFNGLVLGLFFGELVMYIVMFIHATEIIKVDKRLIKRMAQKYWQFLKYGLTGTFINTLAGFAPYVLFQRHFGAALNGQFTMSNQKILAAPTNLIAAAVSPVFYESANRASKEQHGKLFKISKELSVLLFCLVFPFALILIFWGPALFGFFFGEEWAMAGEYARYLAPFMCIKFIVHPLTYLIDICFKLKQQLIFNIIYLLSILSIFGIFYLEGQHLVLIKVYGITSFVLYLSYFIYLMSLAKNYSVKVEA